MCCRSQHKLSLLYWFLAQFHSVLPDTVCLIPLDLLSCTGCSKMWAVLVNVPCALGKNISYAVLNKPVYTGQCIRVTDGAPEWPQAPPGFPAAGAGRRRMRGLELYLWFSRFSLGPSRVLLLILMLLFPTHFGLEVIFPSLAQNTPHWRLRGGEVCFGS